MSTSKNDRLYKQDLFLQSVIDGIPEGVLVIGPGYEVKLMNRAAGDFSHKCSGASEFQQCYKIFHGREKPCEIHNCPLEEVRKTGQLTKVVHEHYNSNGEKRSVEILSSPLYGEDGTFHGIIQCSHDITMKRKIIAGVTIVRDITMRKQAEDELRESERFMDSIFTSIQDGIGIIDKDMNIIRVNKTAESWYSHAMPLVGKKCYEAYHNRKEQCELCPAQETLVTGNSAYRIVSKHGPGGEEVGWHEIYSYPLKDTTTGQMKGVIEYVRDITERKFVEEELKQSEEKYRLLIENIQEGVFVIQDAKMQFVNKAFRKISGYSNEEIIGMDFLHFVAPEDLEMVQDRYSRRQKGENVPDEYEFNVLRRDGEKIIINMSVGIVTYRGRIASMGVIYDITERKKREEAIRRYNLEIKESNRMKELFSDIMHHDLLNPLNVANGYVDFFLEDEKDPNKKSYLETIKRNLVKGMELIENATKFSKLESMKNIEFDDLDLKMVVLEAIENLTPLAVRAGISIENNLESSMPVRANKIIEDIFLNLISNAIKYAPLGKRIIVDGKDGGNFWKIRVIDFGPGIKDADKKLIFERFHREEKKGVKGSGLGLAIAGKIVDLHKGRIWVEDNPEGGALFTVEIPKSYIEKKK